MYRDGTGLVVTCLVGVVLYGVSLAVTLPADCLPEEEEPVAQVEDFPNLISDEISMDPSLPLAYEVTRIEEVVTVVSVEQVGPVAPAK